MGAGCDCAKNYKEEEFRIIGQGSYHFKKIVSYINNNLLYNFVAYTKNRF